MNALAAIALLGGAYLVVNRKAAPVGTQAQTGGSATPKAGNGASTGSPGSGTSGGVLTRDPDAEARAFVTTLYRTLYNREPDQSGLDFWVNNLKAGGTPDTVTAAFRSSDEYKLKHPQQSPSDPIDHAYPGVEGVFVIPEPPEYDGGPVSYRDKREMLDSARYAQRFTT
jgi:hypothetical protein